jgi:cell wall assembly regulator SMI1
MVLQNLRGRFTGWRSQFAVRTVGLPMDTVRQAWSRIRKWYRKNAFDIPFGEKATRSEIRALESEIHLALPDDLKESYLLYNGSCERGIFPYGYHLLSLTGIMAEWKIWQELVQSGTFNEMSGSPVGPIKSIWWNVKWIPFTANSGNHDCVDMDPAESGSVGQVIEFSHEAGPQKVAASSFQQWLIGFATELENGLYRYDEDSWTLLSVE